MKREFVALATLFFVFLFINPKVVCGLEIRLTEKIKFEEKSKLQIIPKSFCVTEDRLFLIPDHQAGNIKIFEKDGKSLKLVKTFGRKGFGSDEFNKPSYCFYDKYESKFGVIDVGRNIKNVFIYDRIDKTDFRRVRTVKNADGYDMKLGEDAGHLIISGYNIDKKKRPYELYSINLGNTEHKDYLLSSPEKYQISNYEEFNSEYYNKRTLPAIGIRAFMDAAEDFVYFVWEGKLIINKINLNTKEKTAFGQQTEHYVEPSATPELLKARSKKDYTKTREERAKMSFVRDIFATPKHVLVVYEGPNQSVSNFRMQAYTPGGRFLDDIPIPGSPGYNMCFEKESYTLYSLLITKNEETQIVIYKVTGRANEN